MKELLIFLSVFALGTSQLFAVDKAKLADHLKKALNLDSRTKVVVGDSKKSNIGKMIEVPVWVGRSSQQTVYMTPDEKYYFWGTVFELNVDPDQFRTQLMDLSNAMSKGSAKAPVTIVEYTDIQCPYCKNAHTALNEDLYKTYDKNQVRWVFKHFPLGNHKWAEPAAVACECAREQKEELGWEMSDLLFENSKSIKTTNINEKSIAFAKELKLDVNRFKTCLKGDTALKRVQEDKKEGLKVGVSSTPTLFVNGRMKRGFRSFDDLKVLIDDQLKEAQ